jgi:hypothetical protein
MIGAIYATPFAFSIRERMIDHRLPLAIVSSLITAVLLALAMSNGTALMVTTSLLVITTLALAAVVLANTIARVLKRVQGNRSHTGYDST